MSLTRKMLEAMGLDEKFIETIIQEHVEVTNGLKDQIKTYKDKAEKYDSTVQELADVQKQLDGLKDAGGDWETKYNKEHQDFENYKSSVTAKETKTAKESAYKALLKDAGISEKVLDKVLRTADLDTVELENGKIKGAEELTASIKDDWSEFIVQTDKSGAQVKTPPKNDTTRYSMEQIRKMTPDEINANWDDIKDSMAKGE